MSAYNEQDSGFAGLGYGIDKRVETAKCGESAGIDFGLAIMAYAGDEVGGYSIKEDTLLITFSADLVTSNSVALTINGTALSATVFATSHDNTMDLIKAKIEAAFPTAVVTLSDATNNRQITVYIKNTTMSGSGAVTLGDSQATIAFTLTIASIFRGIALHVQKESAAEAKYLANEAMNVITKGWVWVPTSETVQANTPAYIVKSGANAGKFATSGYPTNARFRSSKTGAGLALVEVFGMYDGI
jgi:hypothetical protein